MLLERGAKDATRRTTSNLTIARLRPRPALPGWRAGSNVIREGIAARSAPAGIAT